MNEHSATEKVNDEHVNESKEKISDEHSIQT